MKRILSLSVAVCLVSALCALGAETWKGSIGDKMCGAKHMDKDPVACTKSCIKGGSAYVFVIKDKVYDIENAKDAKTAAELDKHAGHNVEVTGTMSKDGKSVKIDSIKAAAAK